MYKKAFNGGNNDIYLVKDNKIIGNAKWAGIKDGVVSVYFKDESIVSKFSNHTGIYTQYVYFYYSIYTGDFLSSNFDDDKEVDEFFDDTRIVDAFNLRWGMVPDSFKDVEGYRKAIEE